MVTVAGIHDISFKSVNTSEVTLGQGGRCVPVDDEQYSVFHRKEVSPESDAPPDESPYYAYRLKCADELHRETGYYLGIPCTSLSPPQPYSPPPRPRLYPPQGVSPPMVVEKRVVPLLSPPPLSDDSNSSKKESIICETKSTNDVKQLAEVVESLKARVQSLEEQNRQLRRERQVEVRSKRFGRYDDMDGGEEGEEDPRVEEFLSRMAALMEILNKKLSKQERAIRDLKRARELKQRKDS